MFKLLSLFLTSIFTFAGASSLNNSFNNDKSIVLEEESSEDDTILHGYTYTDDSTSGYNRIIRTFDSLDLAPSIETHFKAPNGLVFTLNITDDQMEEIMDQAAFVDATFSYTYATVYYTYFGSSVYTSEYLINLLSSDRDTTTTYAKSFINNLTLFEVEELTADVYLSTKVVFYFKCETNNYELVFNSDIFHFEACDVHDYINVDISYFERGSNKRISVFAEPIDGFFNQTASYNEDGFLTDTTMTWSDEVKGNNAWKCKYEMKLIGNDNIPLGNDQFGFWTMSYPDESFTIKVMLTFTSGGVDYTYYSHTYTIRNPEIQLYIDGFVNRNSFRKGTEHHFYFESEDFDYSKIAKADIDLKLFPCRLNDIELGHVVYSWDELPKKGLTGHYYYIPSSDEKPYYEEGRENELDDSSYSGALLVYNEESESYEALTNLSIVDYYYNWLENNYETTSVDGPFGGSLAIPFAGKWMVSISCLLTNSNNISYSFIDSSNYLTILNDMASDEAMSVNVDDNVNLVIGGGDINLIPTINLDIPDDTALYYGYEVNKNNVVDITENGDGSLIVTPSHTGLVNVTIYCESDYFSRISKTVSFRVIEMNANSTEIDIPDEFHYSGKDITASISVYGITKFSNLDIKWKILDKNSEEIPEDAYVVNKDATLTLLKPSYNDYTISASYEGVELDNVTIEVRDVNLNAFLKINIWWILLLTLSFLGLIIFLMKIVNRNHTTVEHIEKAYNALSSYVSDDKLTKEELQKIQKIIRKCLNHCEDLNINALNQYEKSIRYLRKSNNDAKKLLKKWDNISSEDKLATIDNLNADLSKALLVAKEIESARQIIEENFASANKLNYEKIDTPKDKKK